MRQEYPDASNSPNHHKNIIYTDVDVSNKWKEEHTVSNDNNIPPYMEETKRQVAIEDNMYAVVNKQQKKKQNEDTPPAPPAIYSNTADQVYYNTAAAVRKGHAVEDEETPPQIPPTCTQ
jgi:hypothetical protein